MTKEAKLQILFRLHLMHEMQTIVTDVCNVSQSVTRLNSASLCGGHSVQPLPNHFSSCYISSVLRTEVHTS